MECVFLQITFSTFWKIKVSTLNDATCSNLDALLIGMGKGKAIPLGSVVQSCRKGAEKYLF